MSDVRRPGSPPAETRHVPDMAKAVYLLDTTVVSYVEARKCDECKAIVASPDMSAHLNWHASLEAGDDPE